MTESVNDLKPQLMLHPELPVIPIDDHINLFQLITKDIVLLGHQTRKALNSYLSDLKKSGIIKNFKDLSDKYSFRPFCQIDRPGLYYHIHEIDQMKLEDLAHNGFVQCAFIYYEIVISKQGPCILPKSISKYSDSSPFLDLPRPWNMIVSLLYSQVQKTQDKLRFGGTLRLKFPLVDSVIYPDSRTCRHDYLLKFLGTWEWRLVWECKLCGYRCHCSCFQKAIQNRPFPVESIRHYSESYSISVDQIPFEDNACEVCRGVPSTHEYSHEMYARSLFEQRYGAYIEKRLAEIDMDYDNQEDYETKKREITNQVRESLGFKKIGEGFVNETELFRIVKAIFPGEEVIHHYRNQWLEGLELDIYVPSKKLGIEYQGIQHFQPISSWGGEKAFEEGQIRDTKKQRLCEGNNIILVFFTYEEDLNSDLVKSRILRFLNDEELKDDR